MQCIMNSNNPPLNELIKRFRYNPDTGLFSRIKRRGGHGPWTPGSLNKGGYYRISVLRKTLLSHRAAYAIYYGEYPQGVIDHINGIKGDNRIVNLRCVSHDINMKNRSLTEREKKKFKGCYFYKKRDHWVSRATIEGKVYHLGSFKDEMSAHNAYLDFIRNLSENNKETP